MNKNFYRLLLFVLFTQTYQVTGQHATELNVADYTKPSAVLPPSPDAGSLGKFGGVDFGLASGTMNYSLPLYTLTSTNLSFPVSISYSSNGFKVDEIATKVGTSWNLNAGGVITRTVLGTVDEFAQRIMPPADFPQRTRNLINFMENLSSGNERGPFDGQPDLFSFNFAGYSGKFILNQAGVPQALQHSNLLIEKDFSSSEQHFTVTGPDGIKYYFGGPAATESTRTIQDGTDCGKHFPTPIPTAWYLTKIIHPNNDTITLSYTGGGYDYQASLSQTLYSNPLSSFANCPNVSTFPTCEAIEDKTCVSHLYVSTKLLAEVNSSNGNKIKFSYTSPYAEVASTLTAMEIYKPHSSTVYKRFDLLYVYVQATNFTNEFSTGNGIRIRPFLEKVIEQSADASLSKTHTFRYNDWYNLPPRLSFAQDHYGFFNGKANTSLLPKPETRSWEAYFPEATANREADPLYSSKGLLAKIIYPTGGEDTIVYEGNSVYDNVITKPADTLVHVSSRGTGVRTSRSTTFYTKPIPEGHIAMITAGYGFNGVDANGNEVEYDPLHHIAMVDLIDENTGMILFSATMSLEAGSIPAAKYVDFVAGHTYKVVVTANGGSAVSGSAHLTYKPGKTTSQFMNKTVGGVRVAKIITKDNVTGLKTIKKYHYSPLNHLERSSGGLVFNPRYENLLTVTKMCAQPSPDNPAAPVNCSQAGCYYYTLFSNSQTNLYFYPGSPVYYSSVIESEGENFENGGTEHRFELAADVHGKNIIGENVVGAPLTSYSWKNGREIFQHVFRKQNSTILSLKKIFTSYQEDTRINYEFQSFIATKKYQVTCQSGPDTPPSDEEVKAYNLMSYVNFQNWSYVDTVRTWTYNPDGQSYLEQVDVTQYANPIHALPTKVFTTTSDQKQKALQTWYTPDVTYSGEEEVARQNLLTKHIYTPLEKQIQKANSPLYKIKTSYKVFNGLALPQSQLVQMGAYPVEKRIEFLNYNEYGKLLEQAKFQDIKRSYLYDYESSYPVAEALNTDQLHIAYTSFEADSKGNWDFTGSVVEDVTSPTGTKCYQLGTGAISRSNLISSNNYVISYWIKGNTPCSVTNSATFTRGKTINGWTYFEHQVNGSATISLNSSNSISYLDEVRLYPVGAQMITNTYDPLVGVTSSCDVNNQITYYEYDGLGRLSRIKDGQGKILKKYEYKYANQGNL